MFLRYLLYFYLSISFSLSLSLYAPMSACNQCPPLVGAAPRHQGTQRVSTFCVRCFFQVTGLLILQVAPLQAGGPRGATTGVQRIHLMQTLHVVRGD